MCIGILRPVEKDDVAVAALSLYVVFDGPQQNRLHPLGMYEDERRLSSLNTPASSFSSKMFLLSPVVMRVALPTINTRAPGTE